MKKNSRALITASFIVWFLVMIIDFVALFQTSKIYVIPSPLLLILWMVGCGVVPYSLQKMNRSSQNKLPKWMRIVNLVLVFYLWGLTMYFALDTKLIFAVFHLPSVINSLLSIYLLVGMFYPFWLLTRKFLHS